MLYKMVIIRDDGNIVITHPEPDDYKTALACLRDGTSYLVDLRDAEDEPVLQIVELGGPEGLGVAIFPEDMSDGYFSLNEELSDAEILEVCAAFGANGAIGTSTVRFEPEDWRDRWDRPAPAPSIIVPCPMPADEEVPDDPQEVLNDWLERGGGNGPECLAQTLAAGATFEACTAIPPLVFLAQKSWVDRDAIADLLQVGCDITAVHGQGTALWHAVEHSHYDFADALQGHGARPDEAVSSKNYERWQTRNAMRAVTHRIDAGDVDALRAWLKGRPQKEIVIDLLTRAVRSSQLEVLEMLLAHKGRVQCKTVHSESLWGYAMAQQDVRYIDALVRYGAYESVALVPGYGGREFQRASVESLRYLDERGLTAGFERGFVSITNGLRPRHAKVLDIFPDEYFVGLDPRPLARVACLLVASAPERLSALLDRVDFAAVLKEVIEDSNWGDALTLAVLLTGDIVEGSALWARYRKDGQKDIYDLRADLAKIGISIACN